MIWFVGLPWLVLVVVGMSACVVRDDDRFIEHPATMGAFGIMASFLGVIALWRPRTYLNYLRLDYALRLAKRGHVIRDDELRAPTRRETISAVGGGIAMLLLGAVWLVGAVKKL